MTNFNQSKIKMWRRCEKQYAFRYDYSPEGKELVPRVVKLPLQKGTWLHALLEAHFREEAGLEEADWMEVHKQFVRKFNTYFDEEKEELGDLPGECLRIFKAYLRFYRDSETQFTTATLPDGEPALEFVVEAKLPDGNRFKGRIDRLVEDTEYGGLWIWDHKWVKTVPDTDERMMSPQAPMYVWALQENDYDVRGFLYNYGRTKAPTVPQRLQRGGVSQRKNLDTDLVTYVNELKDEYGDQWKIAAKTMYRDTLIRLKNRNVLWFRRERVPVEQDRIDRCLREFLNSISELQDRWMKEEAPRSYFYNCKFGCEYHGPCVAEFQGLSIENLLKKNYELVEERYAESEKDLLSA